MVARGKVGLKEIAKEAGVAMSTASHALNGTAPLSAEVRERVLEIARRLGYLEKRRRQATITSLTSILVAMAGNAALNTALNLVSWTILDGLKQECERRAIRVVPHVSGVDRIDTTEVRKAAFTEKIDGIVVLADDRPELVRGLTSLSLPVVIINGEDPSMTVDTVTGENRFGARLGIEHLLSLGHRRIMHLTWKGRTTIRRRFDGYADAYLAAGLPIPQDLVVEAAGYTPDQGQAAIAAALRKDPQLGGATAIFCAADNLALGCLTALAEADIKVPDQISVLGFDGIMPGEFAQPPLSTIQLPIGRLGEAALSLLEQRLIANDPLRPAYRLELGCRLVRRGSVAPPRGAG